MVVLAPVMAWAIAACADVTSSATVPASIEFRPLSAPALVVGDTLRDIGGVASPAVAIVRNQQGEPLPDAPVRYTYADAARDTAIVVDSVTGFVISRTAFSSASGTARIAARVGNTLQVIRTVLVTTRPDSVDRLDATSVGTLAVAPPDTGAFAQQNTSAALTVTVRHLEGTVATRVPNWLVKYEVMHPANPTNDSTLSAFLVNDAQKLSNIDTTDGSGSAGRLVRVRAALFPVGTTADSVVVRVLVSYRGQLVRGAPVTIVIPVVKRQ